MTNHISKSNPTNWRVLLIIIILFLINASPANAFANYVADSSALYSGTGVTIIEFKSGTLQGIITDKETGAALEGVSITIPDLKIGTVSDASGHFEIEHLPKGIYLVHISLIGYGSVNEKIKFNEPKVLNVAMKVSWVEANQVVVTGLSKAAILKRDPVPMVAVSKEEMNIHASAGNVIAEIASVPGVSAVTTGPNISKPFIRGLGYNRVVTAENGIRLEGQQWGDEHGIEVDQNAIEHAEVIKGPASLVFGPDAIGGVVNLLTPTTAPDGTVQGSVTGLYGTNNGLMNGSIHLQGNHHGFVWGTVVSAKAAKNYQNKRDGRVYATNFREKDARVMLGLQKSWGYSYFHGSLFDDEQAIPDGSRDPETRRFTKQITEEDDIRPIVSNKELNSYSIPTLHQRVQLYRLYNNSNIKIGSANLLLNLGYQYSQRQEFTHPTEPTLAGLHLQLSTYTYDAKFNFLLGDDYETTIGVNGMYQNNKFGRGTDFPIPEYHQFDIGPFFVVKKNFGELDLSAGARYDTRAFRGKAAYLDNSGPFPTLYTGPHPSTTANVAQQFEVLKRNFHGPSGSFGASYNFSDAFLIKGNVSTGFRAPSIAELSANGADPGSQIYHVGNEHFKPEYSIQGDIGAFYTDSKVSVSAEVFLNHIQNYIYQQQLLDAQGQPERVDANGTANPNGIYSKFTYVQSKARIAGGEFNMDIHPLKWLHFENSLTLTYGTNLGAGGPIADTLKYLPFIPPLHSHSELKASFAKGFGPMRHVYVFGAFDHFNQQDRFFAAYGTETYTAGYNLLSAGVGGQFTNRQGKELFAVYVEGTNLLNTNYQSNMSRLKYFDNAEVTEGVQPGIFNMGRNISFKVIVPLHFSAKAKSASNVNSGV